MHINYFLFNIIDERLSIIKLLIILLFISYWIISAPYAFQQ
ncbi:putative membrane protein [Rickettsia rhipicephali str. Ect]|uniref:Putative membrane protein n=1 Tax=Rickettsia rhipicephali str. Ect TaxID=1359199 RepID=A0A0F3PJ42_RICRH|nr:putative membrane protein [Rickettsia rhipicephali str. Ect]